MLLGLAFATLEETLIHTDDGCAVEVHCNACLLGLGTHVVPAAAFSLPRVVVVVDQVTPTEPPAREEATPRRLPSRGPPPV